VDHAQEFRLQGRRQFADLIQKNRAAVRLLEAPDPLLVRPGEGALLVAEELAFEQVLGNRLAITVTIGPRA
jgi:hypothetical protein